MGPLYTVVFSVSYLIVVIVFVKDFRKPTLGFINIKYRGDKVQRLYGIIHFRSFINVNDVFVLNANIKYINYQALLNTLIDTPLRNSNEP